MCKMRRFPKTSPVHVVWAKKADNRKHIKTNPNNIRANCRICDIHFSVAILRNLIRRQCIQYWREFCSTAATPANTVSKKKVAIKKDGEARSKDIKINKGKSNTFPNLAD